MENIRDALLMFPPSDILLFFLPLCLSRPLHHPDHHNEWRECVWASVQQCIWASVTVQITAQRTSEHPVFKRQLSGRGIVTALPLICCPRDTTCLTPVYNEVLRCTSKDINSGKSVKANYFCCFWKYVDLIWLISEFIDLRTNYSTD